MGLQHWSLELVRIDLDVRFHYRRYLLTHEYNVDRIDHAQLARRSVDTSEGFVSLAEFQTETEKNRKYNSLFFLHEWLDMMNRYLSCVLVGKLRSVMIYGINSRIY